MVLVENVLAWDVATHEVVAAVQWSESEACCGGWDKTVGTGAVGGEWCHGGG